MFHHVARARLGTLLFIRDTEGKALWTMLCRTFPEVLAAVVMPDHVHVVLPHADPDHRLGRLASAYARFRNHRRRGSGAVWAEPPPPEAIPNDDHVRRTVRYVHLNPCRAHLVADPLAWPWSTHREHTGFALPGPIAENAHPARFHAYVSGDPTVDVQGTALPTLRYQDFDWPEIVDAVCGLTRTTPDALLQRGPTRTLAVRTAWIHGMRDRKRLFAATGLELRQLRGLTGTLPDRGAELADETLAACVRAAGDPRFRALTSSDCRSRPSWFRYRNRA